MEKQTEEDVEEKEYIVFPEEVIDYLPKEIRDEFLAQKEAGVAVLEAVDAEMKNIHRLANAFPAVASLRYVYNRLSTAKFEATMEAAFEHDMLTSVFAITYARLIDGGLGSGVSRSAIPANLREAHDYLIVVRNKRFAHHAGHQSLSARLEIELENGEFDIKLGFNMGFHVGGANEWKDLVEFIEKLMSDRLDKQLERLREKTGRVWRFPNGPPPSWA
ncbi:hypothetical protein [Rhizobium sp. Leaf386]|uniref:hypothetical protein n=1 Tax=Rhizobium sp. Leaf386 TaxID=1736359 RepID=UPI000B063878|nr:hypothetical protein [Rhizobium sp. Leaf386]